MGLFDIFKRKDKTEPKSQVAEESTNAVPLSAASEVSASAEKVASAQPQSAATTQAENVSEAETSATAQSEPQSQTQIAKPDVVEEQTSAPTSEASSAANSVAEPDGNGEESKQPDTSSQAPAENSTENKYEQGLVKSRTGFGARLNALLANFRRVDEDFFDNLEEALIESDVGFEMAVSLSDQLREEVKLQNAKSQQEVTNVIIEKLVDIYEQQGKNEDNHIHLAATGPTVLLFVGVNGVGKTTTIGKMAAMYQRHGKKVLLAAADTFRAGATEQLQVWGKRDHVKVVTGPDQGDPAAVVFDAVKQAKDENYDVLFVDTAGRLQNKVNLMNELAKMKRIISREIETAPHEVLLVLDATTGQNALTQAKLFKESTDVTGIVLTKLDGTARGGIVLAIRNELHLPVKLVGLGEQVDDLQAFDASEFVYGLFKDLVKTND